MARSHRDDVRLGILLSFGGYSAWVATDALIKLASRSMPTSQILAVETFIGVIFIALSARFSGGLRQLRSRRPGYQLLCAALIMAASVGSIVGVSYLSLADFYTIIFTSPLVVTVIGHFFMGEKTSRSVWAAIILGFAGVLIAVRFDGAAGHALSTTGVLATSIASLSLSLSIIAVRAVPDESSIAVTFWPRLIGLGASLIFLGEQGTALSWPVDGLVFAGLAGILGGLGALLTNASLRFAPMAIVSPYHYTQIIGGMAAGYIVWHDVPAWPTVGGAAVIAAAGLFILRHRQDEQTADNELPANVL